ncbi:hypothetical protein CLV24_101148 [Pontibacter ummariensis]|uniref:Uncharacterized protein n=1 Tax=Pontibacter ummariensis TaxID=1610492 RepID=A0A239B5E2_9BACT|nr:hypothetical protein [Pontibacter ummariensis]PRY16303.1 hypothetical protein CLV24_101148 [Pontibacter ummariensis]SNS02821.1 hypothetical protein SAMN06296052_101148 [Pontibacter ummariensis]
MQSKLTRACTAAVLAVLISCDKDKDNVAPAPVGVDKVVRFEIFATKDYTTHYYADYDAKVSLWIVRTDKATMKEIVVLDTTFTRPLKAFPLEADKLVISKKITGVADQNEWIGVGSGTRMGAEAYSSYESFPADVREKRVEVKL